MLGSFIPLYSAHHSQTAREKAFAYTRTGLFESVFSFFIYLRNTFIDLQKRTPGSPSSNLFRNPQELGHAEFGSHEDRQVPSSAVFPVDILLISVE